MTRVDYTPELAAKFCAAVAEGDKSIRAICKMPGMPSKATVFRWLIEHKDFLAMYERAKDEQADTFIDEVVEIADKCKPNTEAVQKAKLRIYARIEAAQKMKPRKYGKLLQLAGEGGGPVAIHAITRKIVRPK
jgi:transposase-like protein